MQLPMPSSLVSAQLTLSRVSIILRRHPKLLAFGSLFFLFLLFLQSSDPNSSGASLRGQLLNVGSYDSNFGGAFHAGQFVPSSGPDVHGRFSLTAIADLDQKSAVQRSDGGSPTDFYSILRPGVLRRVLSEGGDTHYSLDWGSGVVVSTRHNEAGRGMELSELVLYDDRLMTFDDRTGIVFEIIKTDEGEAGVDAVPRFIVTEGAGETDKGMKIEWSTVKDGNLYVGSFGKEFTNKAGVVVNRNNLWISVFDHKGRVSRYDWTRQYDKMRETLGCQSPGYLVHEAIHWSDYQRKWMILPRRVSRTPYDDVEDESKGSNVLLVASENFSSIKTVFIKIPPSDLALGTHGFSTFAFVPGTRDRHAVALRSVEERCTGDISECKQRTYAIVFDTVTGDVLMDEQIMSDEFKFEGIAFVDITAK